MTSATACGTDGAGTNDGPVEDARTGRHRSTGSTVAEPDGGDDEPEAGTDSTAFGASPEDAVLTWANPSSCVEAVYVYSSAAWQMLTSPEMEDEGWSSDVVGMTREEAVAACESEEVDLGMGLDELPGIEDLDVTESGSDRVTITWSQSGSGPDGSSGFTYTWDVVLEDGGWRINDIGGSMDIDAEVTDPS